jgi:dTMP kinase
MTSTTDNTLSPVTSSSISPSNVINVKKPQYICFEGTEGVGKTTQTKKLCDYLISKGYRVLQTKEPGIDLLPITMELRTIMLNKKYDTQLSNVSRELISQAIRSIHMEKLVYPAIDNNEYDFIIQDRGILSGLAYGEACGNEITFLVNLASEVSKERERKISFYNLYDKIIYLKVNVKKSLELAKASKQEYEEGDAIEAKGTSFMELVQQKMDFHSIPFKCQRLQVENKDVETVFAEILKTLKL